MTDPTDDDAQPESLSEPPSERVGETPVQRALRLKTARLDARPKPPRGGRFQREQASGVAAGASRPWTHK